MSDFQKVKAEFEAKKAVYMLGGENVTYEEVREAAKRFVECYNEHATLVAKKFKKRPKLLSVHGVMQ